VLGHPAQAPAPSGLWMLKAPAAKNSTMERCMGAKRVRLRSVRFVMRVIRAALLCKAGASTSFLGSTTSFDAWTVRDWDVSYDESLFDPLMSCNDIEFGGSGLPSEIAAIKAAITTTQPLGSTPLPTALPLFATGLGGLGLFGWRRK